MSNNSTVKNVLENVVGVNQLNESPGTSKQIAEAITIYFIGNHNASIKMLDRLDPKMNFDFAANEHNAIFDKFVGKFQKIIKELEKHQSK